MMRWRGLLMAGETGVLLAMFGRKCSGLEGTVVCHGASEESHVVSYVTEMVFKDERCNMKGRSNYSCVTFVVLKHGTDGARLIEAIFSSRELSQCHALKHSRIQFGLLTLHPHADYVNSLVCVKVWCWIDTHSEPYRGIMRVVKGVCSSQVRTVHSRCYYCLPADRRTGPERTCCN